MSAPRMQGGGGGWGEPARGRRVLGRDEGPAPLPRGWHVWGFPPGCSLSVPGSDQGRQGVGCCTITVKSFWGSLSSIRAALSTCSGQSSEVTWGQVGPWGDPLPISLSPAKSGSLRNCCSEWTEETAGGVEAKA